MIKKPTGEQEEAAADFAASSIIRGARLRREAKSGSPRAPSKRRIASHGRRKNPVIGGIHLRGNKRTLR